MILSDSRILEEIAKGTIKLEPYDRACLGGNSYDVHLGKWLATYREHILDAKKHNEIEYFEIPEDGFVLYPHIFYLGVTQEYTETHAHIPFLEGKSSTGRLGPDRHRQRQPCECPRLGLHHRRPRRAPRCGSGRLLSIAASALPAPPHHPP